MNQYVKARQSKIGVSEEYDEGKYSYREGREERPTEADGVGLEVVVVKRLSYHGFTNRNG